MSQTQKIKICLVGETLSGGGAERSQAFLSNYFAGHGIEVHHIIVQDVVTYGYSGELLNMGKFKNKSNGIFNKLKRFWIIRKYIKKHNFDYIIDFRIRIKPIQDYLISRLVFTVPTVYSVRHSIIDWYMPPQTWLTKLIYGKSYGVHCINNKMKSIVEETHGLTNVKMIYNAVDKNYIRQRLQEIKPNTGFKYIIATGRMGDDNIKQFDRLIDAYSKSILPQNNIKLMLLGQGTQKEELESYAIEKGLANMVVFKGFESNPYIYMRDALFFVLSSKKEGTPMVLLESLACDTPVVAFDCLTGPSEIIQHKENGLLINDQDFEELTKGINLMCEDKELYLKCKANAVSSIEKFELENIGRQWLDYLKINV